MLQSGHKGSSMRIAVLADIHGNLPALEAVMADLASRHVDQVVTLGDHLSGPLLPGETAAFLMQQSWVQIAGNHERQLLSYDLATAGPSDRYSYPLISDKQFAWLRSLPPIAEIDGGVLLCHGTPRSDLEYLLETVEMGRVRLATAAEIAQRTDGVIAPVVLCGHTHVPRAVRTGKGQLLVNPGSVGLPAFDDTKPSYHVVETGSPDARYALLENQTSGWTAALLSVSYDFEPMARLADQHSRPDWAHALRTGYVLSSLQ
jgi:putative phosphoesterase